ncbi:MAG: TadE family type IV pilus minor pilin [Microbacterium sp.]
MTRAAHARPVPPGDARRDGERGSVTAELALAIPAVVVVVALAVGALSFASAQVRLQDAAADAARLIARGEDGARAAGVVAAAVSGATHGVSHEGETVCITARARVTAGPLDVPLEARSCALAGGL